MQMMHEKQTKLRVAAKVNWSRSVWAEQRAKLRRPCKDAASLEFPLTHHHRSPLAEILLVSWWSLMTFSWFSDLAINRESSDRQEGRIWRHVRNSHERETSARRIATIQTAKHKFKYNTHKYKNTNHTRESQCHSFETAKAISLQSGKTRSTKRGTGVTNIKQDLNQRTFVASPWKIIHRPEARTTFQKKSETQKNVEIVGITESEKHIDAVFKEEWTETRKEPESEADTFLEQQRWGEFHGKYKFGETLRKKINPESMPI